jgi:hypothetical protein
MWRCITTVFFPLARVIGADPANALSARASANRFRSSPISARTRAPTRDRPRESSKGWLRRGVGKDLGDRLGEIVDRTTRGVELP